MNFKQATIGEILDSEREMVARGAEYYGEYFINAADCSQFLGEFLKTVNPDRFIFAMFLSQVRKHHALALFSAVRLHQIQALMDMRQVLEAGSCAAYAIANTAVEDFADVDDAGILDASKELTKKRYDWLTKNYPDASKAIHEMKKSINSSTAHANIVYAHQNFTFNGAKGIFETPFFDRQDEFYVKTTLWTIGNVGRNLMDIFYGVNRGRDVLKFSDDFISRLKTITLQNERLKAEMMASDRFKQIPRKIP